MQDERVRLLASLGATHNSALIQRLFDLVFSDYVRKQDRFNALLGVTRSAYGRRALWHLVKGHIDTLPDDLGTTNLLSRVIKVRISS